MSESNSERFLFLVATDTGSLPAKIFIARWHLFYEIYFCVIGWDGRSSIFIFCRYGHSIIFEKIFDWPPKPLTQKKPCKMQYKFLTADFSFTIFVEQSTIIKGRDFALSTNIQTDNWQLSQFFAVFKKRFASRAFLCYTIG